MQLDFVPQHQEAARSGYITAWGSNCYGPVTSTECVACRIYGQVKTHELGHSPKVQGINIYDIKMPLNFLCGWEKVMADKAGLENILF